ncbi:DNA repair and recombination protein RAD54 [Acorus gramineus]|uniref:DNA repair and recombination protein RAD54 n=1 Tax=Acorus gramineus TaxID=55184 RepID=A0AAV9BTV7_ACOGR|nr:DNA repair and recombination protein RAD54 [Acorus gramineus]
MSSFNALKETLLRPCTTSSSSTTTANPSQPPLIDTSSASISDRRPPKSSLSQQLQRLQQHLDEPSLQPQRQPQPLQQQPIKENDRGDEESHPVRSVALPFALDQPYEPLVLSDPDERPVVQVPASINCRLLAHQREGVRFLYQLYRENHGGVLGDDMGLGKTIQTIAFLGAVLGKDEEQVDVKVPKGYSEEKRVPVLIVCPTSVIRNWENEFSDWGDFNIAVYHGPNRDLIFEKLEVTGVEVLITSFDTFRIHDKILAEVQWDIVIVDEAHKLKNEKSQLYKAFLGIKTKKRFGLTGTIMQNKISELFNLFDWVSPGSLGTREHFRDFYDEPLKHGQRSSAPDRFVKIAEGRKKHLVVVLRKYLLRRTKEETIGHLMLGKEDNVVFCAMSELQKRVYKRMLELPEIQCLINKDLPCSCGSPLTQAECCHQTAPNGIIWSYLHRNNPEGCESCPFCLVLPCLIKLQQVSNHLELIKPNPKDDIEKQKKDAELASSVFGIDKDLVGGTVQTQSFMGLSDVEHCGKMQALEKLLSSWVSHGDKILLFSYSVRMLDILEKFLIRKGYCFSRLDGSTPMNSRQFIIDEFNTSPSKQVFLISTRAGGLGLNLVSANRVVIFDPNWNPSQDLQAQDRSFRFGQKRHVVVFRLLAAGSLEELVYSRQVYKQQLSNIAVSGKMEKRYFEGVQDCKEFKGELFGICNLFRDLSDKQFTSEIIEMHDKQGQEDQNSQHNKCESAIYRKDPIIQNIFCPYINENDNPILYRKDPRLVPDIGESRVATMSMECEAKLHDLGIVYAHRNEDVVNSRPQAQGKMEAAKILGLDDYMKHVTEEENMNVKTSGVISKGEVSLEKRKKIQYHRIAQYNGMDELDFSRWLLSASPYERQQVLHDYKKRKQS